MMAKMIFRLRPRFYGTGSGWLEPASIEVVCGERVARVVGGRRAVVGGRGAAGRGIVRVAGPATSIPVAAPGAISGACCG